MKVDPREIIFDKRPYDGYMDIIIDKLRFKKIKNLSLDLLALS